MADGTKIEWAEASVNPVRARDSVTGKIGWLDRDAAWLGAGL